LIESRGGYATLVRWSLVVKHYQVSLRYVGCIKKLKLT